MKKGFLAGKAGIFFLVCFPFFLQAQDPGTVINVQVNNAKTSSQEKTYQLWMSIFPDVPPRDYKISYREIKPSKDQEGHFRYFEWDPYNGEIFVMLITSGKDSMQIRFQLKVDTLPNKIVWNAQFSFEIPFQPGYFEIVNFITEKGKGFTPPQNHSWMILPPGKRKLM